MERPGISVAFLRPLAQLLAPDDLLATIGVDDTMPPNSYVDAARVDDALAAIAARRNDPAFALTIAKSAMARPLGVFGHMVWLSGSVRDALSRAVRFWAMVTRRTTLSFDEHRDHAIVRQHPVTSDPRGRILVEYPFASLALRTREATRGAFALRAVRFAHRGAATPAYTDVFRAPVEFEAEYDELEFDPAQLDLPLAGADPITSSALESTIAQMITDTPTTFLERVRAAAAEGFDDTSPARIAKRLGISPRTLRRHLEQHGETLTGVVDALRRERADQLLAAGTPVKEIAFALGFSEPSAFSRAYKRWTGKAPRKE